MGLTAFYGYQMKYILALLLTGCANIPGVDITSDERTECKAKTCSVWTFDELKSLANRFLLEGFSMGKKSI